MRMRVAMPIQKSEKKSAEVRVKARSESTKVVKRSRGGREMVRVARRNVYGGLVSCESVGL